MPLVSLDSPGSLLFPAYLYSGEHTSKPEWSPEVGSPTR